MLVLLVHGLPALRSLTLTHEAKTVQHYVPPSTGVDGRHEIVHYIREPGSVSRRPRVDIPHTNNQTAFTRGRYFLVSVFCTKFQVVLRGRQ